MFGSFNLSSARGVGMIVLQALRVLSVISLTSAIVSCWLLILKIDKKRQWFPFEGASLFFLSCLPIVLIISEFPILNMIKKYLRRSWPAVGPEAGIGWLGTGMVVVGCQLLGKLNQPAFDAKNMGDSFRQLVLAAGLLNLIFGALNVVNNFLWADRSAGITARDVRSKGSLAESQKDVLPQYTHDDYSSKAPSSRKEKARSKFASMFWKDDGRPNISLPINRPVHHPDVERVSLDEDRASPIVPGVKRPDTALHPMHARVASSRYSEANMSRF